VIREQMLETRTALTEKLEALQETVVNAVEGTTESVTETVQNVKDAVQDTVANVSDTVQETVETVKSTFDISKHVESYPWAMFGGAVALGYLGGRMFPSPETLARAASAVGTGAGASLSNLASNGSPGPSTYTSAPQPAANYTSAAQPAANFPSGNQGSNWLGGLAEALKPVAHQLEGMAIGALTGVIGEMAMRAVPEGFKPQLKELIEKTTTSLGGESMDCSSLFNSSESGSEKRPEHQHS
jgi:ElaB/YqjD/DUF883 family membrane-anchored ribosome-binding protein